MRNTMKDDKVAGKLSSEDKVRRGVMARLQVCTGACQLKHAMQCIRPEIVRQVVAGVHCTQGGEVSKKNGPGDSPLWMHT